MISVPSRRRATAIIELPQGILLAAMASGIYLLPGGAVDPGERSIQAVIREVREETGLVAHTVVRLFEHTSQSNRHAVFLVRADGKPTPRQEVKQMAYYQAGTPLAMSPATQAIIQRYLALKAQHPAAFGALATFDQFRETRRPAADGLRRNSSSSFVGIAGLKRKHRSQLDDFERWAAAGSWHAFHSAHYDWWMFPLNRSSAAHGVRYTVYAGDVAALKQDAAFIGDYLRGVELLALAWGWDAGRRAYVPHPQPGQQWANWPIRLHKAAESLLLFGFPEPFESLRCFALDLINRGESFRYGSKDLRPLFTAGLPNG